MTFTFHRLIDVNHYAKSYNLIKKSASCTDYD